MDAFDLRSLSSWDATVEADHRDAERGAGELEVVLRGCGGPALPLRDRALADPDRLRQFPLRHPAMLAPRSDAETDVHSTCLVHLITGVKGERHSTSPTNRKWAVWLPDGTGAAWRARRDEMKLSQREL